MFLSSSNNPQSNKVFFKKMEYFKNCTFCRGEVSDIYQLSEGVQETGRLKTGNSYSRT